LLLYVHLHTGLQRVNTSTMEGVMVL